MLPDSARCTRLHVDKRIKKAGLHLTTVSGWVAGIDLHAKEPSLALFEGLLYGMFRLRSPAGAKTEIAVSVPA